ncbi:MAG: HAD family hydrolase [Planctomycetota bacterium]|jgi:HAD superfamily hydrolase (TIGR01509 family)
MNHSTIKLVCFDLGGVLVRICRSWEEGCAAAGIEIRQRPRTDEQEATRKQAVDDLQTGDISPADFWNVVSQCLNHAYSPQEIELVHRAWTRDEYKDVVPLIQQIHDAGHTTACLSNTNAIHWEELVNLDSLRALHSLHASHEMRLIKPDEAIYEAFEKERGCLPHEIVFFEDTEENALAARNRGWLAHVIDPHQETVPQMRLILAQYNLL